MKGEKKFCRMFFDKLLFCLLLNVGNLDFILQSQRRLKYSNENKNDAIYHEFFLYLSEKSKTAITLKYINNTCLVLSFEMAFC